MERTIDAKGLICPKPVILAKKAMEECCPSDVVTVFVDNEIASVNLRKLASSQEAEYAVKKLGDKEYEVKITVTKEKKASGTSSKEEQGLPVISCTPADSGETVVVIGSGHMGEGDETLGRILLKGFLFALTGLEKAPGAVLLYNEGAFLSCEGSESLEDLQELERQGAEILTCGTCLQHYHLTEKLAVGKVTNMYGIVERQAAAAKILRP